jgi:23S rRNA (guanosine2251-2'-O)-methyltransferase
MVIHGRNPVLEAFRSGKPVYRLFLREGSHFPRELLDRARTSGAKMRRVSGERIRELAGEVNHQGIVAYVADFDLVDPGDLIQETVRARGMLLVLDGVEDPRNVGDIVRTAEFLGASGVVMGKDRSPPLEDALIKASAGAAFHLPLSLVTNLGRFLEDFKRTGGWAAGLVLDGDDLSTVDLPRPLAWVLGSEGKGIRRGLVRHLDLRVTIPGRGRVESLNVSCAAAIAVFHALSKSKGDTNG